MLKIGSNACLVALLSALGTPATDTQQPQSEQADAQQQGVQARDRSSAPSAAAQYSPLAATGGYHGQRTTWYEAALHSLNPRNIDWGNRWEQRRSALLANSIGNSYFVFSAVSTLLLIYSIVVIVWHRWDHAERYRYF